MEDVISATPTSPPKSQASSPQAPAKKSSTTLSVDRAAFLLLRVKKAFKRKRQHRKEKQAQALNATLTNQAGRTNRGKVPPPLLRSRTLPAIIVPGIPVVSLHTDKSQGSTKSSTACGGGGSSGGGNRWSLLARNTTSTTTTTPITPHTASWNNNNNNNYNLNNNNNTLSIKSLNLPNDDATLVYRRKSSGSAPHGSAAKATTTTTSSSAVVNTGSIQYGSSSLQTPDYGGGGMPYGINNTSTDEFECYAADGSVLLRIPAPHVVAARAYRFASQKRTTSIFGGSSSGSGGGVGGSGGSSTSTSDTNTRCSGNNTPTFEGGFQIPGPSGSGLNDTNNVPTNTMSGIPPTSFLASALSSNASTNIALTRRLAKLLHQSSTSVSSKSQQHQQQTQHDTNTFNSNITTALTAPQQCGEDAPRRLSWERRKDSSALQRSASIDSFAEIVWCDSPRPSLDIPKPAVAPFSKRPSASSLFSNCSTSSQSAQLNINELCVSGSVGSGGSCGVGVVGGSSCGATSTGNSRRESLLSPSSTRRNKLTRIINGK